eukprot:TRINITY_DN17547_c0_g1_i2.p1 TRINITY_DN17547_c0_g1~~TRINITY_DN17547_c0_g1_i2.p1  ORF type:complete len:320 (-),score=48.73 TRINITY_DN17547_c0_g1_i2:37-996(-)
MLRSLFQPVVNNRQNTCGHRSYSTADVFKKEAFKLPIDITLVRHGESEGNWAQKHSKMGDDSYWSPEFMKRHTSKYRLTDNGRKQADIAGEWIRKNIGDTFDAYYVSEYARARETAAHLRLPSAKWFVEFYLREKDKGVLAGSSHAVRKDTHGDVLAHMKKDAFYVAPPGGESFAETCLRADWTMQIWRHMIGSRVIAVCHGNIMLAFRVRLEKMSLDVFRSLEASKDPKDKINFSQILHYTRRNPFTGEIADYPIYMKSVCPWDLSLSSNEWKPIVRPEYSNEDLLQEVNDIPQLVNCNRGEELEPGSLPKKGTAETL